MAQNPLAPPPPTGGPIDAWLYLLWRRLTQAGQVLWSVIDTSGSNLTDIATRNHNDLQNLDAGDYVHLTAANHTDLTDGGNSALHYHATDRDSANFTGTNWTDLTDSGATTLHKHAHNGQDGLQGGTTDEYYHLTSSQNTNLTDAGDTTLHYHEILHPTGSPVVPKTSGVGIKVDVAAPTFGWADMLGPIGVKTIGATDPVWTAYRGSLYAYTFDSATAEAFFVYHIPHDWLPSQASMLIHAHWSQNVVDTGGTAGVPGVAEWNFDISYADGHGTAGGAADPFIAPITVTVTQQGSTTQYGHMIAEVEFANNGGTGGKLDTATMQVDGILLVRMYRTKANAADTLDQAPFVHTCDIHYQTTGMLGTKQNNPITTGSFYV